MPLLKIIVHPLASPNTLTCDHATRRLLIANASTERRWVKAREIYLDFDPAPPNRPPAPGSTED
jgi:hypothetical protein